MQKINAIQSFFGQSCPINVILNIKNEEIIRMLFTKNATKNKSCLDRENCCPKTLCSTPNIKFDTQFQNK